MLVFLGFFLLFPLRVEHVSLRWFSLGFRRLWINGRRETHVHLLRIKALKELKVCVERQKTDESHFQLVLSSLTLTE